MNSVVCRRLDQAPDLLFLQQQHTRQYPFLLDSAGGPQSLRRFSLLLRRDFTQDVVRAVAGEDFCARLDQLLAESVPSSLPQAAAHLPFAGGWFVYLGYELAAQIEPSLSLSAPAQDTTTAAAWPCDGAWIIDHHLDQAWLVAADETVAEQMAAEWVQHTEAGLAPELLPDFKLDLTVDDPAGYRSAVARIKEYILAGDVFQVNLSRAWQGRSEQVLDPFQLYRQLRQANPAPFAALCQLDEHWLLSSSPERLVEMQGRAVQTRPIAGTRPRSTSQAADQALGEELLLHPKERAEHVMLIDLERNDLGRVCRAGSVQVSELMVLESHAHVHHIVSNIVGELLPDIGPGGLVRAVFPGGTITGCPKVRCMEIIAELEQLGRGYYTGSLGYLSRHGRMDLNILIRTLICSGHDLAFRTGAGIVADSDPQREVDETVAKARGLCLALGVAEAMDGSQNHEAEPACHG